MNGLHSVRADLHPDPRPAKRIVDRHAYRLFHANAPRCIVCGRGWAEAHHMVSRAQGGDDVQANFLAMCSSCHSAYHNGNRHPRTRVAKFLRSEAGEKHAAYLVGKLGVFGAENFVMRLEGRIDL